VLNLIFNKPWQEGIVCFRASYTSHQDFRDLIFALHQILRFVGNLFLSRCQKLMTTDVRFVQWGMLKWSEALWWGNSPFLIALEQFWSFSFVYLSNDKLPSWTCKYVRRTVGLQWNFHLMFLSLRCSLS
jgi:hypothetical protein